LTSAQGLQAGPGWLGDGAWAAATGSASAASTELKMKHRKMNGMIIPPCGIKKPSLNMKIMEIESDHPSIGIVQTQRNP
jgi:hypothetical protein